MEGCCTLSRVGSSSSLELPALKTLASNFAKHTIARWTWVTAGGLGSNAVRKMMSELDMRSRAGSLIRRQFFISNLADPHEMIFIHPHKNFTRLREVYRAIYFGGIGCSQVPGLQAIRRASPRRRDGRANRPASSSSTP